MLNFIAKEFPEQPAAVRPPGPGAGSKIKKKFDTGNDWGYYVHMHNWRH